MSAMSSGASRTVPLASLEPAAPAAAPGPAATPAAASTDPAGAAAAGGAAAAAGEAALHAGVARASQARTRLQPALRWQPQGPHLRWREQARGAPAMVGPETRERPRPSAWCSKQTESPSVRTRGTRIRVRQVRWAEVACWRHQVSRHRSGIGRRQDSSGSYEQVDARGPAGFLQLPLGGCPAATGYGRRSHGSLLSIARGPAGSTELSQRNQALRASGLVACANEGPKRSMIPCLNRALAGRTMMHSNERYGASSSENTYS